MLHRLHEAHLGIVKTKQRARDVMFWPGMGADIEAMIKVCDVCLRNQPKNANEPLKPHPIPNRPWAKLGADLFVKKGKHYVTVMDYYSKYIEVRKISSESSKCVINGLKSIFSTQGIPEELISDNGPCFRSNEFASFTKSWDIKHVTSSPNYARSNGQAESAVKIVKSLMEKAKDPYLAMLEYRTTPLTDIGLSPSQLLNSRRLRSRVPTATDLLLPQAQPSVLKALHQKQHTQKQYHDRTARKMPSRELEIDEPVRMYQNSKWIPAEVTKKLPNRSYMVVSSDGAQYRRTRSHLLKTGEPTFHPIAPVMQNDDIDNELCHAMPPAADDPREPPAPAIRRSGRARHAPKRLIEE